MSYQTYTTTIKGHTVSIKTKKDLAKHIAGEIEKMYKVNGNWIELSGVIGGEERRSQLWTPFGGAPVSVVDPDQHAADCEKFMATLPALIDESNMRAVVAGAQAVFEKHLPVEDNRTTPDVHAAEAAERAAKVQQWDEERAAALASHIAQYGESAEYIPVPEGMTPIVAQLHYNNSDMMTDYFDAHRGHGPEFLLGFVSGRPARTERLHRDVVAKFPQLAGLSWTWGKENYSMGRGNFLAPEIVGSAEGVQTSGGLDNPPVWWEVSFGYGKQFVPLHGYAASLNPASAAVASAPSTTTESVIVADEPGIYTIIQEREWTWIKFPSRPTNEVLDILRSHGGKWGHKRGAWYFRSQLTENEVLQWLGIASPAVVDEPVINSAGAVITAGLQDEFDKMQEFIAPAVDDLIIPALEDITMAAEEITPAAAPAVAPVAPSEGFHPSRYALFE